MEKVTRHTPAIKQRCLGYRGQQVLNYITGFIGQHGRAPTYREICSATGLRDKEVVRRIVQRLEKRGVLARAGSGRVRSFQLAVEAEASLAMKLRGAL